MLATEDFPEPLNCACRFHDPPPALQERLDNGCPEPADFLLLNEPSVRISSDALIDFKPLTKVEMEQILTFNKRTGRRKFEAGFN
jgi:hypothetical protein